MRWPWDELGLSGPAELSEIRRAYARGLRSARPEEDPEGFQRLHLAYRAACAIVRKASREQVEDAAADFAPEDGFFPESAPVDVAPENASIPERAPGEAEDRPGAHTPENRPPESTVDSPFADGSQDAEGRQGDFPVSSDNIKAEAELPTESNTAVPCSGRAETAPPRQEVPSRQDVPPRRGDRRGARPGDMDWDFARLFAEGEAEERGRGFLQALERRKRNRIRWKLWERRLRRTPEEVGRNWVAASVALQTLNLLSSMEAGTDVWRSFLESDALSRQGDNPDFVFGLEEFLQRKPDLPGDVREMMRRVFARLPFRWERVPLLRLLEDPARKRRRRKRLILLCALILAAVLACFAGFFQERRQEQVRQWLEEDFGREFRVVRVWGAGNRFAPADAPEEVFFASPAGRRDLAAGQRGYRTNFPNLLLDRRLSQFAGDWGYGWIRSGPGRFSFRDYHWDYYLDVPLTGADAGLTALGAVMADLRDSHWYRLCPPDGTLYVCWRNWCFYQYGFDEGSFGTDEALGFYANQFGPELCRLMAERTGTAERDLGAASFGLEAEAGTVLIGETPFFHAVGWNTDENAVLFHYYLSPDGEALFSVPARRAASRLTEESLYTGLPEELPIEGTGESVTVYHVPNLDA